MACYDIEAKAAGPAGDSELAMMLQSLLGGRTDPVGVGPERDTRPSRVYIRDRGL